MCTWNKGPPKHGLMVQYEVVYYSDNLSEIFSYCDIIIHFLHFDIRGSDLGSKLTSQHSNCNVFDNTHTVWKNDDFYSHFL